MANFEVGVESLRERLARDIFIADNYNASEDVMLDDWETLPFFRRAYAYDIADRLTAKGWQLLTLDTVEKD